MKLLLALTLLFFIANLSNLSAAEKEKTIDYRQGETLINSTIIKNGIFPKEKNLTVINISEGIYAYLTFPGFLPAGKIVQYINDEYIEKITICQYKNEPQLVRISFKLKKENDFFYCYSALEKKIMIVREIHYNKTQKIEVKKTKPNPPNLKSPRILPIKKEKTIKAVTSSKTKISAQKTQIKSITWKKAKSVLSIEFNEKRKEKIRKIPLNRKDILVYNLPFTINPDITKNIENLESDLISKIRIQKRTSKNVRLIFHLRNNTSSAKIEENAKTLNFIFGTSKKKKEKSQILVTEKSPTLQIFKGAKTVSEETLSKTGQMQKAEATPVSQGQAVNQFTSQANHESKDNNAKKNKEDARQKLFFGGKLNLKTKSDLRKDNDYESTRAASGKLILNTEYLPEASSFKAFASIETRWNTDLPSDKIEADIAKTYVTYSTDIGGLPFDFLVGKNTLRWGKTDDISPVDNLNAEDYRLFLTEDYADRKIPAWMVNIMTRVKEWDLEFVYLPFFQKSKVDLFGSDWSIAGYFKEEVRDKSPFLYDTYVADIGVQELIPEKSLSNGEFAIRIAKTLGDFDTSLIWSYTHQDRGEIKNTPAIIRGALPNSVEDFVVDYRKRYHLVGATFESSIGDYLGVRGETAWISDQAFLRDDFSSYQGGVLHTVVGVDYTYSDFYANLQLSHQWNINYEEHTVFEDEHKLMTTGKVSYGNIYGNSFGKNYEIGSNYGISWTDDGHYLKPFAKYYLPNNWVIGINMNIFLGSNKTTIGSYTDDTNTIFEISKTF